MTKVTSVMKYTWVLLMSILMLSSSVAAIKAPEVLVQETTDTIISKLRVSQDKIKAEPGYLLEIVDSIVAPHFDFERMSSWVLGKYWRKASADEKTRFAQEFRTLLVRTYAKALNDNYDKPIDMLAPRKRKDGKQVTVRTEIQQSAGFPIPISYKMHMKKGAWKIFDVRVDSISLVTNYRSSFAKEIRKDGLEKLIARLADRNRPSKAKDATE